MTSRFLLLTFVSCIIVFATMWAVTAPKNVPVTTAVAPLAPLYADCDAVRAANAAPLRADQPGYRPALDGNMNGVACEPVGTADSGANPPAASTEEATPSSYNSAPNAPTTLAPATEHPAPEPVTDAAQEISQQEM